MLIPSIDLMGGRIVQLVQGERLKLAFDDFEYWIEKFSRFPLVQLIDLDAAMRQGDNRALLEEFARRLPCQVGGGIHSLEQAKAMLDAGARRIILGSVLFTTCAGETVGDQQFIRAGLAAEFSEALGRDKLVFSVDTKAGRVAVKGWKEQVDLTPLAAIRSLEPFCDAFLYTHIDTEGTMQGFPLPVAQQLRQETCRQLIVAGGIREQSEIDALDAIGVDTVAGMAIYSGRILV